LTWLLIRCHYFIFLFLTLKSKAFIVEKKNNLETYYCIYKWFSTSNLFSVNTFEKFADSVPSTWKLQTKTTHSLIWFSKTPPCTFVTVHVLFDCQKFVVVGNEIKQIIETKWITCQITTTMVRTQPFVL